MPVRQRPTRDTLSEREIQQRIERGAGESADTHVSTRPEQRVGVLLKIPVSLKDRLDRHLQALPIKRASWILMAIYEKLERDEQGDHPL
jgi:hypothetical protein